MEININGSPTEIADFIVEIQNRKSKVNNAFKQNEQRKPIMCPNLKD